MKANFSNISFFRFIITNIVLTAKSAVIFFKYITLRTNIKKVQYTTNSVPHFFRQIGQDLTFIA